VSIGGYRNSSKVSVKLPRLETKNGVEPFRIINQDMARAKGYMTPSSMVQEVRVHQFMSPLGKELNLKNLSALEVHRFVQDKMKASARANPALTPIQPLLNMATSEDNNYQNALRLKLNGLTNGRKEVITNQVRFDSIENPFKDYSMTLQTLKKERHAQWLEKKKEKQAKINE